MGEEAIDAWRAREAVLVIGPGAIGALVAGRLSLAGHPVTVACRTEESARRIRRDGVIVTDADGRRSHARVEAATVPPKDAQVGPWRLVVVATKVADAEAALAAWWQVVPDDAQVVAMQNGLPDLALMALAGDRLVECVVAFPATLEGPGESVQTGPGDLIIGRLGDEQPDAALVHVVDVLRAVVPCSVSSNILGAKWTKLLINACITTMGVVSGTDLGVLLKDRRARALFLRVMAEGVDVGRAEGVSFEAVSGLAPGVLVGLGRLGPPGRSVQHQVLRVLGRKVRRQRSSSLQSLARGRKTEVDALNGVIVSRAASHRHAVPVNAALLSLVHRIERGELAPSEHHIGALVSMNGSS